MYRHFSNQSDQQTMQEVLLKFYLLFFFHSTFDLHQMCYVTMPYESILNYQIRLEHCRLTAALTVAQATERTATYNC